MNIYHLVLLLVFQFSFDNTSEFSKKNTLPDSVQTRKADRVGGANIIFKSVDGGQTWQDISIGLPENLQADSFVEKNSELYIRAGNGLYHSNPNAMVPLWEKEFLPDEQGSIAAGKTGIYAYNYSKGQFLQKLNGTGLWLPMYANLGQRLVRSVFETTRGTIFIGSDNGLFKSIDSGKTWKQVQSGGWVMKIVESDGILMATSQSGIVRSADDGENWDNVISEGGVGIAVESIKGGFAAITYNTESETRRVRISYDGGKIWKPIDAGLPASLSIASIIEVDENFFCGHPNGVFKSSDKGKTWKLSLPPVEDKVFNLSVSGKVIYAISKSGGC